MKNKLNYFLVVIAALSPLYYEHNWETGGKTTYDGNSVTLGIGVITLFVLAFKIFSAIEELLITKRLLIDKVKTPYDKLPYYLFLLFFFGLQYRGDLLDSSSHRVAEFTHSWIFKWGINENKFLIFLFILIIILVYRILQLLRDVNKVLKK